MTQKEAPSPSLNSVPSPGLSADFDPPTLGTNEIQGPDQWYGTLAENQARLNDPANWDEMDQYAREADTEALANLPHERRTVSADEYLHIGMHAYKRAQELKEQNGLDSETIEAFTLAKESLINYTWAAPAKKLEDSISATEVAREFALAGALGELAEATPRDEPLMSDGKVVEDESKNPISKHDNLKRLASEKFMKATVDLYGPDSFAVIGASEMVDSEPSEEDSALNPDEIIISPAVEVLEELHTGEHLIGEVEKAQGPEDLGQVLDSLERLTEEVVARFVADTSEHAVAEITKQNPGMFTAQV